MRNLRRRIKMENKGEIIIYQTEDNQTQIEVHLEEETVWLSLNQMSVLFDRDKSVISRHIKNIYQEGELSEISTVAKFATIQNEGGRKISREIKYYNLDVIISVGYRVKSLRGTQFRIWANNVLKEFLVSGYVLNEKLLSNQTAKLKQLHGTIQVITSLSASKYLNAEDKDSFLMLLKRFSIALNLLDDYDYNRINKLTGSIVSAYRLDYDEVQCIIRKMKFEIGNSEYFGKEKDESLKSSISAIYQTFDDKDLYPSLEEKAANLLYFLVKNHSFIDGNKRIAAALFLYFLAKNNLLAKTNLDNNLLVSLTLMIANSKPSDKDLIVNIVSILLQNKE
jgi:prophage maintenance system killer protein